MTFSILSSAQGKNFHLLTVPDALSRKRQNRSRNNCKRKKVDKKDAGELDWSPCSVFQYLNIQILNTMFFSSIKLIGKSFSIHLHITSKLKCFCFFFSVFGI